LPSGSAMTIRTTGSHASARRGSIRNPVRRAAPRCAAGSSRSAARTPSSRMSLRSAPSSSAPPSDGRALSGGRRSAPSPYDGSRAARSCARASGSLAAQPSPSWVGRTTDSRRSPWATARSFLGSRAREGHCRSTRRWASPRPVGEPVGPISVSRQRRPCRPRRGVESRVSADRLVGCPRVFRPGRRPRLARRRGSGRYPRVLVGSDPTRCRRMESRDEHPCARRARDRSILCPRDRLARGRRRARAAGFWAGASRPRCHGCRRPRRVRRSDRGIRGVLPRVHRALRRSACR